MDMGERMQEVMVLLPEVKRRALLDLHREVSLSLSLSL
jgi:hypothetical protein